MGTVEPHRGDLESNHMGTRHTGSDLIDEELAIVVGEKGKRDL